MLHPQAPNKWILEHIPPPNDVCINIEDDVEDCTKPVPVEDYWVGLNKMILYFLLRSNIATTWPLVSGG